MNEHVHYLFREILAEYTAPRLLIGDRCEALVARSRAEPVWVAGTVEHIDMTDPNDVRLDLRADDGRLLAAVRADCTLAIVTEQP